MAKMTDSNLQGEWNEIRKKLFLDVVDAAHISGDAWNEFLSVLTIAYDYKVPAYSNYRALRTFAVSRWPLLKPLCQNEEILTAATEVLRHTVVQRELENADALEDEMELLRQLLEINYSR